EGFDEIRSFRDLAGLDRADTPGIPVITDPTLPPPIVGPGTRQIYTRKMARLLVSRAVNRLEMSLVLFHEKDEDVIFIDQPDDSVDNDETGGAVAVVHQLSGRTRLNGDLMFSRRNFDPAGSADNDHRLFRLRLGARYELGQRAGAEL